MQRPTLSVLLEIATIDSESSDTFIALGVILTSVDSTEIHH